MDDPNYLVAMLRAERVTFDPTPCTECGKLLELWHGGADYDDPDTAEWADGTGTICGGCVRKDEAAATTQE